MRVFIRLFKGIMKRPIYVLGLIPMFISNLVVPLFFLASLEAQLVLGALLTSKIIQPIVTVHTGFSRLLGLSHIFWFPLVYFLWVRLDQIPADDFFGIWVRALIIINSVSLVIDSSDVIRYIAGDREEMVKGL